MSENLDWLISVDDHILEPPNVWIDRVPAADRDRAPHMVVEDGMDYWLNSSRFFPATALRPELGKRLPSYSQ